MTIGTETTPNESTCTSPAQPAEETSIQAQDAIPAEALEAILDALRELPEASGLDDDHLKEVACSAFLEDKLHDEDWVVSKLVNFKTQVLLEGDEESKKGLIQIDSVGPIQINNQAELDLAVENHKQWMEAVLHPRKPIISGRANFGGTNLSNLNFSKVNLSCADFSDCNLSGADLSFANLSKANFRGASLSEANIEGAKFKGADFSGASLPDPLPKSANFENAKMPRKKNTDQLQACEDTSLEETEPTATP